MLPTGSDPNRRITDVLPSLLGSLVQSDKARPEGAPNAAVLIVVDGLGWTNLLSRKAHARVLTRLKRTRLETVIPSTTGAALTSLLTGEIPGAHGLFGYRQLDPEANRLRSTLTDWDNLGDIRNWMRARPLTEQADVAGLNPVAIGRSTHAHSGLTRALLRGAEYRGADTIAERFTVALRLLREGNSRFFYVYIDELDRAGHVYGWQSAEWLHALEELDAQVAHFAERLPSGVRCLLTADHGMVDVPPERHRFMDAQPELLEGVRFIGGEPRFRHLYLEAGTDAGHRDRLAQAWRHAESQFARVLTREEALSEGLFGNVDTTLANRVGDVLVAAQKLAAYYTSTPEDEASRRMIGQHGGISEDERWVPLVEIS